MSDRRFKIGDAVQTRDGHKARIVCDDVPGHFPLVAIRAHDNGTWGVGMYHFNGRASLDGIEREWDLIPAPRKRTVWITDWPPTSFADPRITVSESHQYHGECAKRDGALSCTRVELEEGRFDE